MRGTQRDIIASTFTFIVALAIVAGMYTFGTMIFQSGARISTESSSGGGSCACASYIEQKQQCYGKTLECGICTKESGKCSKTQKVSLEGLTTEAIKRLRVCVLVKTDEFLGTINDVDIYIDGERQVPLTKAQMKDGQGCTGYSFVTNPQRIKEIKAVAGENDRLDSLVVNFEG